MIKNKKEKKGFTLIELIVVVSIILILSGFLVPKLMGYQDKARNAKAVNTARQIFDASMESYTENEGVLAADKVYSSISSVSDAGVASTDVTVSIDKVNAIVNFLTDTKSYTVTVTPSTGTYNVDLGSDSIYKNK